MNSRDSACAGLANADAQGQWAFGTSFDDPLAGVDTTLAAGIDAADLASYCLMLADDALVSAQRLAQWSANAPEVEEELALANIGLDLLGQARLLLARAAAADPTIVPVLPEGSPVPAEDALAFFRDPALFRCVRLVELPNGDFACSITRLLLFATFRLATLEQLRYCHDPVLAAVASKGVKELAYHRGYAARWFITLACGTDESRRRLGDAITAVYPYVDELFTRSPVERRLVATKVAVDPRTLRCEFNSFLKQVFNVAQLAPPRKLRSAALVAAKSGRKGAHTEALSHLLAEMQSVAREHPAGKW